MVSTPERSAVAVRRPQGKSRAPSAMAYSLLPMALLVGCDQAMTDQPRHEAYEPSAFFDDGMSARPLPEGTVPRGHLRTDPFLYEGRVDGTLVDAYPFPLDRSDLRRGRERYGIFCAPCHGAAGEGDGMIVLRGYPRPPSLFERRLLEAPPGHFFAVATKGLGRMPPYDYLVPPEDRWRIAAYIQALQLSRQVPVGRLRPDERAALEKEGR